MYAFKNGQGSIILRVKLLDSSVTTGAGLTGLTSSSSGLIISTIADNEATATAYTQAGSTIEAVTTLGTFAAPTATKCRFKEVDATNHKGLYEIQIADARYAVASAKSLIVSVLGATNLAQCDIHIPLQVQDPYITNVPANVTQFGGANGTFASGIPASSLTAAANTAIATELMGTVTENNGSLTFKGLMRIVSAIIAGRVSISGSTVTFKTADNAKTRATVTTDSSNQRTAITLDATD